MEAMTQRKRRRGGRPATGKRPRVEAVVDPALLAKLQTEAERRALALGSLIREILTAWGASR